MIFVIVWLTSLSIIICRSPCCLKLHYFILFYGWVIFKKWEDLRDISPKKTYRWPTGTGEDAQIANFCEVAQMCPTLCIPMDCSPPGSSIHGIFQARKTIMKHHLTLVRMAITRKSTNNFNKYWGAVEKKEPSYTVGGNADWYSHYGKQCGDFLKNWK